MSTGFRTFAAAIAVAALLIPVPGAKAEMASATVLANTCFSCHGTEGESVGAMPTIKGKPAAYIRDQLMAFKAGNREGTVMNRIVKGFTVEEIKALSRYFSGQR